MPRRWQLSSGVISAAVVLSGAASASDVPYAADIGPVHLAGTVDVDDSSADVWSVTGQASGAVNGKYDLDRVHTESEITVQGMKLVVIFDRRDRQLRARLDACASPDSCTAGNPVTVWQGP